jgi:hypothetical protein
MFISPRRVAVLSLSMTAPGALAHSLLRLKDFIHGLNKLIVIGGRVVPLVLLESVVKVFFDLRVFPGDFIIRASQSYPGVPDSICSNSQLLQILGVFLSVQN